MKDIHERLEVLHERDEDYDTRLHNSYFCIAEARGERDKTTDALNRETRRREAERVSYSITIDRIRGKGNCCEFRLSNWKLSSSWKSKETMALQKYGERMQDNRGSR